MQLINKVHEDFSENLNAITDYGIEYIQKCLPTLRNFLVSNKEELKVKRTGVPVSTPFYHSDLASKYFPNNNAHRGVITVPLRVFVYRFLVKHSFIKDDYFAAISLFLGTPIRKFYNSGFLGAWDTPELTKAAETLRQMLDESLSSEKPQVRIVKEPSFPKYDIAVPESIYLEAEAILQEWTSSSEYYESVSRWFSKQKHKTDFSISYFPYSCKDTNFLESANKASKINAYFNNSNFCKLIRIMAFNYYAEEFLGKILPLDNNINVIRQQPTKTPIVASWDEKPFEEIQEHIELAQTHFDKVETVMNTLTKFESMPSANVHLIHGRPAEDYTEEQLMELIRKARKSQESIKDLVDDSSRMKKKHKELEEAIKVYVAALDALA